MWCSVPQEMHPSLPQNSVLHVRLPTAQLQVHVFSGAYTHRDDLESHEAQGFEDTRVGEEEGDMEHRSLSQLATGMEWLGMWY